MAPPSVWESTAVSCRLSGTSAKTRSSSELLQTRAPAQGRTALKRSGCLPRWEGEIASCLLGAPLSCVECHPAFLLRVRCLRSQPCANALTPAITRELVGGNAGAIQHRHHRKAMLRPFFSILLQSGAPHLQAFCVGPLHSQKIKHRWRRHRGEDTQGTRVSFNFFFRLPTCIVSFQH